jgi:hypothetical protein
MRYGSSKEPLRRDFALMSDIEWTENGRKAGARDLTDTMPFSMCAAMFPSFRTASIASRICPLDLSRLFINELRIPIPRNRDRKRQEINAGDARWLRHGYEGFRTQVPYPRFAAYLRIMANHGTRKSVFCGRIVGLREY